MAYSTPADVRQALAPGLTDPSQPGPAGTAASLSDPELQDAISEADARIDALLSSRYATPLTSNSGQAPVAIVGKMSRDMAAYFATLRYRRNKDLTPQDPVALRYSDVTGFLNRVATGAASLPLDEEAAGAQDATGQAGTPIDNYQGFLFGQSDVDLTPPILNWPDYLRERWW